MSSPDALEPDLVDKLLNVEGPRGTERIRPRLLAETTSVVRRRRIVRRLGLMAALAGCYLAGVATADGWRGASAQPDGSLVQRRIASEDSAPEGVRPTPKPTQSLGIRRQRPVQRSGRPRAAPAPADFEHIRRVSDRYLYEQGDIATALHYYTRALDRASPAEREVSVEKDSWLLIALKEARKEENQNEDRGT